MTYGELESKKTGSLEVDTLIAKIVEGVRIDQGRIHYQDILVSDRDMHSIRQLAYSFGVSFPLPARPGTEYIQQVRDHIIPEDLRPLYREAMAGEYMISVFDHALGQYVATTIPIKLTDLIERCGPKPE